MEENSKVKTLGIDYGEKRIGLAITDDLFLTAQPLQTITYKELDAAIREIKRLTEERGVKKIVVGIPTTLSGEEGKKAKEALFFIKKLEEGIRNIKMKTWDERFTTSQAERVMIDAGVRRKKRKEKIDSLAASIMLQSYVDYINYRKSPKHEIKK